AMERWLDLCVRLLPGQVGGVAQANRGVKSLKVNVATRLALALLACQTGHYKYWEGAGGAGGAQATWKGRIHRGTLLGRQPRKPGGIAIERIGATFEDSQELLGAQAIRHIAQTDGNSLCSRGLQHEISNRLRAPLRQCKQVDMGQCRGASQQAE